MSITAVEKNDTCTYCTGKTAAPWIGVIDAAYCICLKERNDRYTKALEEVHRTGLGSILQFYRPERSTKGFSHGCWSSHVQVCEEILKHAEHDKSLVLEDDFEGSPLRKKK